jgi:VWFA-related protein
MRRVAAAIVGCALVSAAWADGRLVVEAQQPQFRGGVDVVELTVAVMNGKKVVVDLTAEDFQVLDNGMRQDVLSVSRELLPIDVTLVIDTSESLTPALQAAIVSAANGIRTRLKQADRLSLITFNQRIQEQLALRPPAEVGVIAIGRVAGQTSLNDVIGVVLAARPVTDRRQMAIVLTDGYDSTSLLTEPDVLALAGRSNTSMFFIARAVGGSGLSFSVPLAEVTASAPKQPIEFFNQIAAATGGVTQIVPSYTTTTSATQTTFRPNPSLLDEPFLKALDDFRSSYTLRYNLAGVPRQGWHDVSVKVTKSGKTYQVRTRTGYVGG